MSDGIPFGRILLFAISYRAHLQKGVFAMTTNMSCVAHQEKLAELSRAFKRVKEAAIGIPVQYRTAELSSAICKMEEIDPANHDAILAHADWIMAAIGNQPDKYNTNKLRDANLHFCGCVNAVRPTA